MKSKITVGVLLAAMAVAALFFFFPSKTAPEVRFASLSGETFFTSELRGKVVLVNFWATYCGSCVKEMPKLVETHQRFAPRGYETVAVAVRRDDPERVAQFAERHRLPFRIVLDRAGEAAREFGNVRITPMSFLIDRQGRVLKRYVGEPDWAEFNRLVESALAS